MAMQKIKFDLGEKRHVRIEITPESGEGLPFRIRNARWELYDPKASLEDSGECTIEVHELDAFITPKKAGAYTLSYVYEVADETWIEKIKVEVS